MRTATGVECGADAEQTSTAAVQVASSLSSTSRLTKAATPTRSSGSRCDPSVYMSNGGGRLATAYARSRSAGVRCFCDGGSCHVGLTVHVPMIFLRLRDVGRGADFICTFARSDCMNVWIGASVSEVDTGVTKSPARVHLCSKIVSTGAM